MLVQPHWLQFKVNTYVYRSTHDLELALNETLLSVTDLRKLTLIFQPWSPVIDWDLVPEQPIKLFVQVS